MRQRPAVIATMPTNSSDADQAAAQHPRDAVGVAAGHAREPAVEPLEEAARLVVLALQHQHAQRRRQRQRDEARDDDRDRDRDRELAVELAGEAAEERDRHEHRAQREHDRDDGPGDLVHRLDRRLARGALLLAHDALDVLEHDDRVVDHDADREHHAEERQRVDRVAEHEQPGERADQRHRHRGERDQRRAPVLEEQEHDQEHEHHRLGERDHHFADRDPDEARGVVRDRVREALREALRRGA